MKPRVAQRQSVEGQTAKRRVGARERAKKNRHRAVEVESGNAHLRHTGVFELRLFDGQNGVDERNDEARIEEGISSVVVTVLIIVIILIIANVVD